MTLIERDQKYVWHPFAPVKGDFPILPLKGAKGVHLELEDGRKIIDGISSWWVNVLGHSHGDIADVLKKQGQELAHVIFAGFTHAPAVDLSEKILSYLPHHKKVFFSDNGSTAVEVALKMAIQYQINTGNSQRKRIIAIEGAYHGDTFGAMSVGERGGFNIPFEPYFFDVSFIPYPTGENEEEVITQFQELCENGDIAAFIFEPLVQGAAGMRIYSPSLLENLLKIAKASGVVTIADEVFTGFFRTGNRFACEYLNTVPHIFCFSKALTNGTLPLSLTVVDSEIFAPFDNSDRQKAFYHGHSYTGNPLACAVAVKTMELLDSQTIQESIKTLCIHQQTFADGCKGF